MSLIYRGMKSVRLLPSAVAGLGLVLICGGMCAWAAVAPTTGQDFEERVLYYKGEKFLAHRSGSSITTFSWAREVSAQVLSFSPSASNYWAETRLLGPVSVILLETNEPPAPAVSSDSNPGARELSPITPSIGGPMSLEKIEVQVTNDYYVASAQLNQAQGAVGRQVAFISLPAGLAAYLERLTARKKLTLQTLDSVDIHAVAAPGERMGFPIKTIRWQGGEWNWKMPIPAKGVVPGRQWINLDDQWGAIVISPGAWLLSSEPESPDKPAGPRLGLLPPGAMNYESGEVMQQRIVVIAQNQTARQTATLARELAKEGNLQTTQVSFQLAQWLIRADFEPEVPAVTLERVTDSR